MAKVTNSHRDVSKLKTTVTYNPDEWVGDDSVNIGSLQRIADAAELMAGNYLDLQKRSERIQKAAEYWQNEAERLARRISALKGVITKMKRK